MAKKTCTTCFSQDLKEIIAQVLPDLQPMLNAIPDCDDGEDMNVCLADGKGGKKKRAPSKYNLHTSSCMKSGKSMRQCADEWKKQKVA